MVIRMKKRIFSIILVMFMMTAGMMTCSAAGVTASDKAVDYSIGTLLQGSYEGYAHEDNMQYADYAAFNAKGNGWADGSNPPVLMEPSSVTTATVSFNAAGPVTYSRTGVATQRVTFKIPAVDENGNARPVGPTYTEVIYSTNKYITSPTYFSIPAGGTTQIRTNSVTAGKVLFRGMTSGTPGEGTEVDVPSAGSAPQIFTAANQKIGARVYQELGESAGSKKMWGWVWNEQNGSYNPTSPIMNGAIPRYAIGNTTVEYVNIDGGGGATVATPSTTLSVYKLSVYEPDELQLRDAVTIAEKDILGANDSIDNITKDLTLPTAITLDRGMYASVSWSSASAEIDSDGKITPPMSGGGDAIAKLTGAYTVNGKTKNIEYSLTIKEGTDTATDEAVLERASDSLIWSDLSSEEQSSVTTDLKTLPSEKLAFGFNVPITWSVKEGASVSGGAGVVLSGITASVIRAVTENTKVVLTAAFSYNGKTVTKDFSFYISKSKTSVSTADKAVDYSYGILKAGSYEDYAVIVNPNFADLGALAAGGFVDYNSTGTMGVSGGKPTITGRNGRMQFLTPETDSEGNSRPNGNGSETYAISRYSMSANNTKAYASIGGTTSTRHSASATGTVEISTGTASAETYVSVGQSGYTTPAANDICAFMILQRPDGGIGKYTSWFLNETKDAEKAPIFFRENYEPRWGRDRLNILEMTWSLANSDSFNGTITAHSFEIYERDEYLFREAVKKAEKDITFDNVEGDLTLLTQITGIEPNIAAPRSAQIVWTSNRPDVIANDGIVTRPSFSEGEQTVKLTAAYTVNGKTKTIDYTAIVKTKAAPPAASVIVNEAADTLVWSDLSAENQTGVTTDLTPIPLTKRAYEETVNISWSILEGSAAAALTGGNTVTVSRPLTTDIKVTLRATLSYGGETAVKDFIFYVTKTQTTDLIYTDENYSVRADGEVTADEDIELTVAPTANRWIKFENGKGLTINNSSGGTDNSAIAVLNLKDRVVKKGTVEEYSNYESNTVLEFIIQGRGLNTSVLSQHFSILDSSDKQITYLQFTNGSTSSNSLEVNLKCNGEWKNPANTTSLAVLSNRIKAGVTGGNFPAAKFKIIYNRMTNFYTVYGKLASEADSQYTLLVADASPNDLVSKGSQMAKLRLDSRSSASNAGELILKDVKMYTTEDIVKEYILSLDYKKLILNGQPQDSVTGNVSLAGLHYGTVLEPNITNDGDALFDDNGRLVAELSAGQIKNANLAPIVKFTSTKLTGSTVPLLPFDITVKGLVKSLIYNKTVTVSGATADTGSSKDFINDGFFDTAFVTTGSETSFSLTFDLLQPTLFNKLVLREDSLSGSYNVGNWSFEGSNNKSAWTKLAEGMGIGTEKSLVTNPPYTEYRYVRLVIESKNIPAGKIALTEILLNFEPDDNYKASLDFEKVLAPPTSVSADFYLQGLGELHRTPIKWESLDSSVLLSASTIESDSSSPNYEKYKITCIRPIQSKDVTIKLTVGQYTKNYTVRVIGTYTPPIGGGGGGGSSSGGGGSFTGGGVVMPDQNPAITQPPVAGNYFPDMGDAAWAVKYVDSLKERGVVAGDNNGNFNPHNNITREEFAKMIVLALKLETAYDSVLPFTDIDKDHWAYLYVSTAYENGLIQGISEDAFGTGNPITRQDMAVIIARAIERFNIAGKNEPIDFTDSDNIDSYAAEAVARLSALEIFGGDDYGNFRPKDTATRAEASKVLYMMLELI